MIQDSAEFAQLIIDAQPKLHRYAMSLGIDHARAKDVVQETNLTIWKKADTFEEGTNFSAWACRIAYYHVLALRRKSYREQLVFDEELLDYLAERQEARIVEGDEREPHLRACLEKLPANQRKFIDQRYHSEASVREIAESSGRTEGAITQILFRARASLQKCLNQQMLKAKSA